MQPFPHPNDVHIKFDQDWPASFRDIQVWKCGRRQTDDGPLVYYKLTLWAFGSGELKTNRAWVFIRAYDTRFDKRSPPVKFHKAILYSSSVVDNFRNRGRTRFGTDTRGDYRTHVNILYRPTFYGSCNLHTCIPRGCKNEFAFWLAAASLWVDLVIPSYFWKKEACGNETP